MQHCHSKNRLIHLWQHLSKDTLFTILLFKTVQIIVLLKVAYVPTYVIVIFLLSYSHQNSNSPKSEETRVFLI